jgi:hypothetical protein
MLRRALGLAGLSAMFSAHFALVGCGDRELPQDICNWLADDNNCYARFANDVVTQCGYEGNLDNDPLASTTGYFASRDDLSTCIKNGGGQVLFGTAPAFADFPLKTLEFTLLDLKAEECGAGVYAGPQTYSITINPVDADDPGASTNPDGTPLTDDITGGTFTVSASGPDVIDVTCPVPLDDEGNPTTEAESFNFNKLVLDKCAALTDFQPRAILESSPGAPESTASEAVDGYIRFSLLYPPVDPTVEGAVPRIVEYFNCRIPAPPPPCEDGVKNNDETDVDCGGSCAATCAEGQGCSVNEDCTSGNCGLNGGIQQCLP